MTIWSSATPSGGSHRVGLTGLAAALLLALAAPCSAAAPSAAASIELPVPQADQLGGSELFQALGTSRDQLPGYLAPGPLSNDEVVQVEASGDGRVVRVTDEQRIRITGTGDYFLRESGPARAATAAGGDAPVLSLGDIVWQGFSPGARELAARIELDPEIESRHLPLRIELAFVPAGGRPAVLGSNRQAPGAGAVTLTVTNTTAQQASLPTAADAAARPLASALDRLLAVARGGGPSGRLPTTRTGIPAQLPVTGPATRQAVQLAPLRLTGTLSVTGQPAGQVTAVRLDALLRGSARYSVPVRQPGTVSLDLTAAPALDPALLAPPRRLRSWAAWAASDPPRAERTAALDVLVMAAATGSRASAYSPYLGSQLETRGRTTFRYQLAPPRSAGPAPARLTPRPVPISLAVLAGLALLGSGALLWRRS